MRFVWLVAGIATTTPLCAQSARWRDVAKNDSVEAAYDIVSAAHAGDTADVWVRLKYPRTKRQFGHLVSWSTGHWLVDCRSRRYSPRGVVYYTAGDNVAYDGAAESPPALSPWVDPVPESIGETVGAAVCTNVSAFPVRPTVAARPPLAAQLGTAQSPQRQAPSGATALCRDGTYSFSAHRRGTCSHHGGVATWLGS